MSSCLPQLRYKYAVIREGTSARTVTQIEGAEREKQIYASTTNVVTIEITSKEQSAVHFLLKYEGIYHVMPSSNH